MNAAGHRVRAAACACALALSAALAAPHAALAVDGVALEGGRAQGNTFAGVALQWDWNRRWLEGDASHVGGYWELGLGHWRRDDAAPGRNDEITEIGLTPVFRLQPDGLKGPYLEAGIGVHLLSRTSLGDRRYSTRFQFGDHVGFGYRFGAHGSWDIGYRFQHYSNARIKRPNNGINFHQLRVQYRFR